MRSKKWRELRKLTLYDNAFILLFYVFLCHAMCSSTSFSLKDHLFNRNTVTFLAQQFSWVYEDFHEQRFIDLVVKKFPKLELKERIAYIAQQLHFFLPDDYEHAVEIIMQALPNELDTTNTDDDFGDFIIAPLAEYIALYGCTEERFDLSRYALTEITKRFSVEFAVRKFINAFPEKMYNAFMKLSQSHNYHQRRLVSEWSRLSLPRAEKIVRTTEQIIPLLDQLFADKTRYVTRSVANNLNSIAKKYPDIVLETLDRREQTWRQSSQEMHYIVKHSLRTLLKQWHQWAWEKLWYTSPDHIVIRDLVCDDFVTIGAVWWLSFSFSLQSDDQHLWLMRVEYSIGYVRKNRSDGVLSFKVFKIFEWEVNESLKHFQKSQSFKEMTTRKHYPGRHVLRIIINGKIFAETNFEVVLV